MIGVGWTLLRVVAHPGGAAVECGRSMSEGTLVAAMTKCWTEVVCGANNASAVACESNDKVLGMGQTGSAAGHQCWQATYAG